MRAPPRKSLIALMCMLSLLVSVATRATTGVTIDKERSLARIDSLRFDYQALAALAEIGAILPDARAQADSSFLLELLVRRGGLHSSFGQFQTSVPVLIEAIALAEALSDTLSLCEGLRWLSVAQDALGRGDEARRLFERQLALASACGSRRYQGWALVGLAWLDFTAGRSSESVRRYREAITHFEASSDTRGGPWAWNGLGTALSRLGEYGEALSCFRHAASRARAGADHPVESMALNNLGTLEYSLGDPGEALNHFERAHELQMEMGYTKGAVTPALNIALCRIRLGRYDDAESDLRSLLAICQEQGYVGFEGMVLNQQADLERLRGRFHRAAGLHRRTLDLGPGLPLKNRIEARIGLSRILRELGEHGDALSILEDGKDEIAGHGLLDQELILETQIALHLQSLGRHREALTRLQHVNLEMRRLGWGDSRVGVLARAAASCRALGLADSSLLLLREAASVWEAERELPLDQEWREERGMSGRLLYTDLAAQLLAPRDDIPVRERQRQAFDQLQVFKARTLLERMFGPGNAVVGPARALRPLTLDHLQQRVLSDGELVLDFYLGPNVSFLFAVTQEDCRVTALPPEERLDDKIRHHFNFLSRSPRRSELEGEREIIRTSGQALHELLFGDVEDLLGASELVLFSPDGILNLLAPAALLPRMDGGQTNWARIPSATVLARIREKRDSGTGDESESVLALAGCRMPDGVTLPGARKEVDMLARRFSGVNLRVPEADTGDTAETLGVRALAAYTLLHLAAHARVDDQSPWQSAIEITGAGQTGRLSAADIATARLSARLAVLATCESAGGRALSGEGMLGLASAFISAGVPAVLATLWPVDDGQTSWLMDRFYAELAEGRNAATALQNARESLRASPATQHPFFWAGYVLVGDGQVEVPLRHRLPLYRIVLGLLALGAFLLLLLSFRLGRRHLSPRL